MNRKEIILPGKIAVESSSDKMYFIYDSSFSSKSKFNVIYDKKIRYSGFSWMNTSNEFIGIESFHTDTSGTYKGNVVRFDLGGNIVERIYESAENEIAGGTYLSVNDKNLIFMTLKSNKRTENPLEGLTPMLSLVIMDFEKKQVIKKIDSIGRAPNFEMHESPWLFDESRFIYSISGENKIIVEGVNINPVEEQAGIYIYDIVTDQKKLLVPNARFGVCSPVDLRIAYLKDQMIEVLNLKDNSTKMVYKTGSKEKISNIHWTPDGKYIYLVYFKNYSSNYFDSGEKLIEVSTGKEIPFKKIGHGFHSYTWK